MNQRCGGRELNRTGVPHLSEGLRQPVLKRFLMEREAGSLASRE